MSGNSSIVFTLSLRNVSKLKTSLYKWIKSTEGALAINVRLVMSTFRLQLSQSKPEMISDFNISWRDSCTDRISLIVKDKLQKSSNLFLTFPHSEQMICEQVLPPKIDCTKYFIGVARSMFSILSKAIVKNSYASFYSAVFVGLPSKSLKVKQNSKGL